ncbi:hypothetical protein OW715_13485 [Acidithiobacillus ferriphilus]|nr:hypothetical protein [Acidithiobacillus ferriphilus]
MSSINNMPTIPRNKHYLAASAIALALAFPWATLSFANDAGASFLSVGPIGPKCGSFLSQGAVTACVQKKKMASILKPGKTLKETESLDQKEKRFYKNYGKPPKAAAAALLDPTPENIKGWALEEIRSQNNAAAVAAALTEEEKKIENSEQNIPSEVAAEAKMPTYFADDMTIIMWGGGEKCPACKAQQAVLQAMAAENPTMSISEKLVGKASLQKVVDFETHNGLDFNVLPATKSEAVKAGIKALPSLAITDDEYHHAAVLTGFVNVKQLRGFIMALRRNGIAASNEQGQSHG